MIEDFVIDMTKCHDQYFELKLTKWVEIIVLVQSNISLPLRLYGYCSNFIKKAGEY